MDEHPASTPIATLPDLLAPRLDIVFVGINPSVYSATRGHYFARPGNRFWPCLSRSTLAAAALRGLGVASLQPSHDTALLAYGFGFTDVVKRATPRASDVQPKEFSAGVSDLVRRLKSFQPRIACFHGVTGYRHVQRAFDATVTRFELGQQDLRIGATITFLVPSPSAANAHFTPAEQTAWYDRLAEQVPPSP